MRYIVIFFFFLPLIPVAQINVGLEFNQVIYSNSEVGASFQIHLDRNKAKSLNVGPLLVTDRTIVRPGMSLFWRTNLRTKESKHVIFYFGFGAQYSEIKQGRPYFTKMLLFTNGIGTKIRVNKKDELEVFFGAAIDPVAIYDVNRTIYTGILQVSFLLNELLIVR